MALIVGSQVNELAEGCHGMSVQSIAQRRTGMFSSSGGDLSPAACTLLAASISKATRRAYQGDLADFLQWGGTIPCTPEMLAEYISGRADLHSPVTISRRIVGVARAHTSQGLADPSKTDLVRTVLRGLRKAHGRPQRQAAPVMRDDLLQMLAKADGVKGARDRALILLGFAAALRRSELVGLDAGDIEFKAEGLVVHLTRSKTDQEGKGRKIAVPYGRTSLCPVFAVRDWLALAPVCTGPVFRSVNKTGRVSDERLSDQSVALIVKSYAAQMGHEASAYSGHSLRSGLVTSAAQWGVSLPKIQEQTGHRSVAMLMRYIRDANIFQGNAAGLLL